MTSEHKSATVELTESDYAPWLRDDQRSGMIMGILLAANFLVLLLMTIGVAIWTHAHQAAAANPLG